MCSCFHLFGTGAVPVVADFGGPGDIVHPDVGYKVALTTENDVVAQMEKILTELAHNRDRLEQLRRQGIAYVRECLTWDAKAQSTTRVLNWVVRRGPKPRHRPQAWSACPREARLRHDSLRSVGAFPTDTSSQMTFDD